nr:hypothetical protein Iba_chr12bCG10780 [Ipomoea batatas]
MPFHQKRRSRLCLLTEAISCLEADDQQSEGGDGLFAASRTSKTGLISDRLPATTSELPAQSLRSEAGWLSLQLAMNLLTDERAAIATGGDVSMPVVSSALLESFAVTESPSSVVWGL